MKTKNLFIYFFLITCSLISFSQGNESGSEKYSLVGSIGLCDLRFIHPENLLYPGDEYKTGISAKIGFYYDFHNSPLTKFYPTIGLSLTGKTATNYMGIRIMPVEAVTRDKFFSLDLPVVLNYEVTSWLKIKGGINGSQLVMTTNYHGPTERNFFTFGYLLGLSLKYRQYSLNLEYIRDANDMLRHVAIEDASYRCSLFHVGIGYHFHSFRQFRGIIK